MIATRAVVSLALSTLIACAAADPAAPDPAASDDEHGDVGGETHAQAMARCDRARDVALASAADAAAQKGAFAGWFACLATANEAAVPSLTQSPVVREAASDLCDLLIDSTSEAKDAPGQVMRIECIGQRERDLGRVIDAWAKLGQKAQPIAENRATFGTCYEAFDEKLADATSDTQRGDAVAELATCHEAQILALRVPIVVAFIQQSFPERDAAQTENAVSGATLLSTTNAKVLCPSLTATFLDQARCQVDAFSLLDARFAEIEQTHTPPQ
jgi:hypothetical protein